MSITELLAELQQEYIKTLPDKIAKVGILWDAKSIGQLEDEFHKMKGTGKSYGLPEISVLSEAMEKICSEKPDSLVKCIPNALECMNRIYEARKQGTTPQLNSWPEFQIIEGLRQTIL